MKLYGPSKYRSVYRYIPFFQSVEGFTQQNNIYFICTPTNDYNRYTASRRSNITFPDMLMHNRINFVTLCARVAQCFIDCIPYDC
jgi:hypothetical protein